MSKRSNWPYPFNFIQEALSLDNSQIIKYLSISPQKLNNALEYIFLQYLSEQEIGVLKLYYEFNMTLKEIGLFYNGISVEKVREIKFRALRKLRFKYSKVFIEQDFLEISTKKCNI